MTNTTAHDPHRIEDEPPQGEMEQIAYRRKKLAHLRDRGIAYPNSFKPNASARALFDRYQHFTAEQFAADEHSIHFAGRLMLKRVMGKAMFLTLQDRSGRLQLYVRQDAVGEDAYEAIKSSDIGDILGAVGTMFKTKTNELSLKVTQVQLLTKALRPLPDKFHGLSDHELRYRQRYLDLLMNETSRHVFQLRSNMMSALRNFLVGHQFMEVETPMLHVLAGGAAARPFVTHHNALNLEMYLRIAPELYLKRLIVGGFERVFELNRSFRNEGVSTRHNPEFTMLEFYQAYVDYREVMDFIEQMLRMVVQQLFGQQQLEYQGVMIDLSQPFARLTLIDAILLHHPHIRAEQLQDPVAALQLAQQCGVHVAEHAELGKIQLELFEKTVEAQLIQPTFITAYPTVVSPLARANDDDPAVCDRFELFVAGREIANGFSELNDPDDQAERFRLQVSRKALGDEETMPYDEDYITALEYGMPPTGGAGIGIDRLAMLLTNQPSIRDVVLFPHMRPN